MGGDMDDRERLEQALGRSYTVAVQARGKGYVLFIRELGLRHECDDLARGHVEILEKKDAWIRDLAGEGLWDWIVPPGGEPAPQPAGAGRYHGLVPFFIKFFCVALLLVVAFGAVAGGLRDLGYTLEKKIDGVIAQKPEQLEANRMKARAFAQRLRPIVQEVLYVFRSDAELAAGAANATRGNQAAPAQAGDAAQ